MSDVLRKDGSVVPSSQREYSEHKQVGQFQYPMVGIILTVEPSDGDGNWVGEFNPNRKGCRHECTVLAVGNLGVPDTLIPNCIIPPQRPSGIDNFEDDLPRGCSSLIDGSAYNTDFSDVDWSLLDGEWCVVNFIGGRKENAYISNWWYHPSNDLDPATSGASTEDGPANLVQADIKKNRMRRFLRKNGVEFLLNRQGSLMVDTNEAGRTVTIDDKGLRSVSKVDKGGHIQIDVKQKAQMEFNWNEKTKKGPRQGPGSTTSSPVHETDIPHDDQPFSETKPKARETKRTFMRFAEYEGLVKTSNLSIHCETQGSNKGQMSTVAEDTIMLAQGEGTVATVTMQDGKIRVTGKDGSTVNILSDEIQIVTKSGGMIQIKGTSVVVSGKVDISGPLAIGGASGQPPLLGTLYMTNFGTYLTEVSKVAAVMLAQYTALDSATKSAPLTPLNPPFAALKQAWQDFVTNGISVFMPLVQAPAQTNTMLAKNTTSS